MSKARKELSVFNTYLGVRGETLCNFKQIYFCLHSINSQLTLPWKEQYLKKWWILCNAGVILNQHKCRK